MTVSVQNVRDCGQESWETSWKWVYEVTCVDTNFWVQSERLDDYLSTTIRSSPSCSTHKMSSFSNGQKWGGQWAVNKKFRVSVGDSMTTLSTTALALDSSFLKWSKWNGLAATTLLEHLNWGQRQSQWKKIIRFLLRGSNIALIGSYGRTDKLSET